MSDGFCCVPIALFAVAGASEKLNVVDVGWLFWSLYDGCPGEKEDEGFGERGLVFLEKNIRLPR